MYIDRNMKNEKFEVSSISTEKCSKLRPVLRFPVTQKAALVWNTTVLLFLQSASETEAFVWCRDINSHSSSNANAMRMRRLRKMRMRIAKCEVRIFFFAKNDKLRSQKLRRNTYSMSWGGQLKSKKRQNVAFCRLFVALLERATKSYRENFKKRQIIGFLPFYEIFYGF